MGGPSLLLGPILGPRMAGQDIQHIDLGITLLSVTGLLNYVIMTDAYTVAESRSLAVADRAEPVAAAEAAVENDA